MLYNIIKYYTWLCCRFYENQLLPEQIRSNDPTWYCCFFFCVTAHTVARGRVPFFERVARATCEANIRVFFVCVCINMCMCLQEVATIGVFRRRSSSTTFLVVVIVNVKQSPKWEKTRRGRWVKYQQNNNGYMYKKIYRKLQVLDQPGLKRK